MAGALFFTLTVLTVGVAATVIGYSFHYADGIVVSPWHPTLMSIGVLVLLTQGVLAYIANYGSRLPPEHRAGRRLVHGTVQVLSVLFIVTGYMVAYASTRGDAIVHPSRHSMSYRWHVWLGYISLALVVLQLVVGVLKLRRRERDGRAVLKWHGQLGPVVYLLALLSFTFGMNIVFQEYDQAMAIPTTIVLAVIWFMALFALFCGPRASGKGGASTPAGAREPLGASYYDRDGSSVNLLNGIGGSRDGDRL